ncbi:Ycf66 family protein [Cyanobium gracile]|uniref:Ycf66 family protein n=1 Tax=Cyanobium gracile UHCC 0281 TaxID=3110309 RepID=A0ABU5STB6_9CYAN|nr:Ycf66 family protein [Cyanobium gracile]MEA5441739.1 Ycf66 family protein [Cyanobium gracile UHCC 0281]
MLATLGGSLALLLGLLLLLLPLLASELSRARDSVWGAVVLLLGLVLVTSAERLTGAPMLAVLCGGLLIGRLGVEVGQGRWRLLSEEERQRLWSVERWQTSLSQIGASFGRLLQLASGVVGGLGSWLAERRAARPASTKKWVRPEPEAAPAERQTPEVPEDAPPVVSSFEEIDALLEQALPEAPPEPATAEPGEGLGEAG